MNFNPQHIRELFESLFRDKLLRSLIKVVSVSAVIFFIASGFIATIRFYQDRPVSWLWINNPDTLIQPEKQIVYLHDTVPTYQVNDLNGKNAVGIITGGQPHIGDTFEEKVFSMTYKEAKFQEIENYIRAYETTKLGFYTISGISSTKATTDFLSFLRAKGYEFSITGTLPSTAARKGISFGYDTSWKVIKVIVGSVE